MAEEKRKLIRKSVIFAEKFIAETIVMEEGPRYCIYDKAKGTTSFMKEIGDNIPLFPDDSLIGFVKFPSGVAEYGTDMDLFTSIRTFIRKWSDLEDRYEALAALYAMYTWAYDEFLEVPYLRVLADLGSGKSRLGVQVLGSICYKAFSTIAASSISPLFRTLDFLGGTLVLDEADLGDDSDKTSELVQMLNSGYIKGLPMMRSEVSKGGFKVSKFHVFGPKIIISREHFKDSALESRCLVVRLGRTNRTDIPFLLDESLEAEASILRNKLLMWRFRGYGKRREAIDYSFAELDVPPRLKQLLLLVSGIIADPKMKQILTALAAEFTAEHVEQRSNSIEGEIADMLCSYPIGTDISCTDLADRFNTDKPPKEQKNARSISWYLRERLGLRTFKHPFDRRSCVTINKDQFEDLIKKFDLSAIPAENGGQMIPKKVEQIKW